MSIERYQIYYTLFRLDGSEFIKNSYQSWSHVDNLPEIGEETRVAGFIEKITEIKRNYTAQELRENKLKRILGYEI